MKKKIAIVAGIVLTASLVAAHANEKHDLFGLVPGMSADESTQVLASLKFKCEARMERYYDHTSAVKCFTDYSDLTGIEVVYASKIPGYPVISITVGMKRNEPFAATESDISQQFGRAPDEALPDLTGGQQRIWKLDGGYKLTLWNQSLKLEREDIMERNNEAWKPQPKQAPRF